MTAAQQQYRNIGLSLANATESQMFGKPCFKINGEALTSSTHRAKAAP